MLLGRPFRVVVEDALVALLDVLGDLFAGHGSGVLVREPGAAGAVGGGGGGGGVAGAVAGGATVTSEVAADAVANADAEIGR